MCVCVCVCVCVCLRACVRVCLRAYVPACTQKGGKYEVTRMHMHERAFEFHTGDKENSYPSIQDIILMKACYECLRACACIVLSLFGIHTDMFMSRLHTNTYSYANPLTHMQSSHIAFLLQQCMRVSYAMKGQQQRHGPT